MTMNTATTTFHRIHAHLFPDLYQDAMIRRILTESKTIAIVGASTKPESSSYCLTEHLIRQGYHVIPVNPKSAGKQMLGQEIKASLKDIQEPVDSVHVFRRSEEAINFVDQAIDINAKSVWLQVGVVNDEAGEKAKAAGLDFVQNLCPRLEIGHLGIGLVNNDFTIHRMLTESKTIAVVGASSWALCPSNRSMEFMMRQGYHIIPVNPNAVGTKILGQQVVASLQDIQVPIDMVHVFGDSEEARQIVKQAIGSKTKGVWLQKGLVNNEAGKQARAAGLDFVQDACPRAEIERLDVGLVNNDCNIRKVLTETQTIALIGASSKLESSSYDVMDFLIKRGYKVIPVNPESVGTKILGQDVVAFIEDIEESIDMVHVFDGKDVEALVEKAIQANVKSVWLQAGVIDNEAGKKARAAGLDFVQNLCPKEELRRLELSNENNLQKFLTDLGESKASALRGLHAHFCPKRRREELERNMPPPEVSLTA